MNIKMALLLSLLLMTKSTVLAYGNGASCDVDGGVALARDASSLL